MSQEDSYDFPTRFSLTGNPVHLSLRFSSIPNFFISMYVGNGWMDRSEKREISRSVDNKRGNKEEREGEKKTDRLLDKNVGYAKGEKNKRGKDDFPSCSSTSFLRLSSLPRLSISSFFPANLTF